MPNNRFNKQVTPKGYQKGGSVKEEPIRDRKKQPLRRMDKKKPVLSEEGKRKIKSRMTGGDSTGILFPDVYKVKKMGGGRIKKKMGGSLKPVDPKTQKGLSKLPTEVRNKMGYMKKGGMVPNKKYIKKVAKELRRK